MGKTLRQLWDENPTPFKVLNSTWYPTTLSRLKPSWFKILGKTERDAFVGYYDDGTCDQWYDEGPCRGKWELYKEPKEKVPHYLAVCKASGRLTYWLSDNLYTEKSKPTNDHFVRLATEYPPIMLEPE